MCLKAVTKRFWPRDRAVRTGYKVFRNDGKGRVYFQYQGTYATKSHDWDDEEFHYGWGDKGLAIGKWYEDTNAYRLGREPDDYSAGYHIFATLAGANAWADSNEAVYKVRFSHATAKGTQFICGNVWTESADYVTWVARRIKVVSVCR